ncbi:hypothetical protein GCM10008927_00450 [Amylibacter ulvae]|uniref:Oxidoreductase n=1 Tax=Paramylibacter ulvae TaxID=1651968 RepID=A0ABQ3CWD9_9RHOB|nr:DUF934 domain-containing protein [Amylibacter ulvae]GHA40261.1 hypothetical protein GCM10008927_00450 [Amylibacter ulvae]
MSVIVTDTGFAPDDWTDGFHAWDDTALSRWQHANGYAIDVPNTSNPADLVPFFDDCAMIRIAFPSFADGRGFSIARHLRLLGYTGRLRANGHVLADQYAMARRVGFDEVEISDDLAKRQPADQWQFRADWRDHSYLDHVKKAG